MLSVYRNICELRNEGYWSGVRWDAALKKLSRSSGLTVPEITDIVWKYDAISREMYSAPCFRTNTKELESDDGTSASFEFFYEFPAPRSVLEVQILVDEIYPPTRCQHEYDCCGHWYQGSYPRVEQISPQVFKVRISTYQNV